MKLTRTFYPRLAALLGVALTAVHGRPGAGRDIRPYVTLFAAIDWQA